MSENDATSCSTPIRSVIQPQVFKPLRMYVAFSVKNFESPIAAIP